MQRSLIFPRPSQASSKRDHNGAALITLDAPPDLPADVGSTLAALHFAAPSPGAPVVVYFHGNADQVGWGGAYVGSLLRERGMGLFAIEYPGYGHAQAGGGSPTEDSLYTAADVLLKHLVAPKSEGGLEVPAGDVVLLGQSIGGAVALEMAARGHGAALVLLAPFASLPMMVDAAFPIASPALKAFPFLLLDKFDNLAKAQAGAVASVDAAGGEGKEGRRLPVLLAHVSCPDAAEVAFFSRSQRYSYRCRQGVEDEIVPYTQGQALASALGAELLTLEGAGHNNVLNNPHWARFANRLQGFLRECRAK